MSKVVVAVGVVVIVAVAGVGLFFATQKPSTSGTTSTTSPSTSSSSILTTTNTQATPPPGAKQTFDQHLSNIDSRNIPVALNDYSDNAVVVWTGNTAGLGGSYSGTGNIRLLFAAALSTAQQMTLTPSNYIVRNNSASQVTVNATLAMSGKSNILGAFNGTIIAQAVFNLSNGAWKISNEAWFYKTFNVSSSGGATTFPEWQKVGEPVTSRRSADWLHNFAWDFGGPGAALIIYVSIALLAAVLVVERTRKAGAN